jgi:hypothetical protein
MLTEKPKPVRLTRKDLNLVFFGSVVGALIGWLFNWVVSEPFTRPMWVPLQLQQPFLFVVKAIFFLVVAWLLTVLLVVGFRKLGLFITK